MTTKDQALILAVDAAMVEMKNIVPPLRRSECEQLIRAALFPAPAPDCRTCNEVNPITYAPNCSNCTNGDKYKEAPAVVLWRTE